MPAVGLECKHHRFRTEGCFSLCPGLGQLFCRKCRAPAAPCSPHGSASYKTADRLDRTFDRYSMQGAYYPPYPTTTYNDHPASAPLPPATHFSIDVECVATGVDHNARSVAQFSLVDQYENVHLNIYVKPDQPVVSYLTPLTGLTADLIHTQGVPLQQGLQLLRSVLPPTAVLIGQNIRQDVQWLQLKEGTDFQALLDLAGIYRTWNSKYNNWSVFGQDHVARVLLKYPEAQTHDAVGDALKSIRLYHLSRQLQQDPAVWQQAQEQLLATPPQSSFAKKHPSYEGCCMGNSKTCVCGAPFLG